MELGDDTPENPEVARLRAQLEAVLGGQYRIVRLLGRGGMGAVFLARELSLDRLVALKVLPEGSADEEARERFRREARTVAQLNHPNIVPLLGFGDVSRTMYLVMGYVNGESLGARLKRDGKLGADDARRVLADIADGLDYAHRHSVIHRDIKPDNILIDDESGRALLADFGIARDAEKGEAITRVGDVVGTPQYMSPEQARGGALDGRSDLYSLGAVGFALLSGRAPFVGGTAHEVLLKRLSEDAPPLLSVSPGASPELAAIVDRCLAREPAARFADARALRLAIAPTALDDERLPEPLDVLDGRGTGIVLLGGIALVATVFTLNQSILNVTTHSAPGGDLLSGILDGLVRPPTLVPAMIWALVALQLQLPLAAFRAAKARGFLPREIWFAALRQPVTWRFFWYPPRFRRKEDVWHRLPAPYRRARGFATLALGALFVGILTSVGFVVRPSLAREVFPGSPTLAQFLQLGFLFLAMPLMLIFWAALVASAFSLFQAYRLMRARGFDQFRLHRAASALIYGPTADRSLWKQPDLAALLAPLGEAANKPPATPGEYPTALSRIAAGLSGDANSAAAAAALAASRFAEEIARIDRSLQGLERDADPKETQRVEARLIALAPDTDERRELLDILRKERDVLKRCAQRLEEARAGRAKNLEALSSLWLSANLLKASPTKAASQIRSLVGPADLPPVTMDVEAPTRARSAEAGTSGDTTHAR
jgi:serine/threonine protein kinase